MKPDVKPKAVTMPGSQKARPPRMRYCSRCVYPQIAVFVTLEDTGACSGCRVSDQKKEIDWKERGEMLREILEEYRSKDGSNYDCIIPVSGGKDSYFQTYTIKEVYGLKPLLVTYHGNNYLPEGQRNLERMRDRKSTRLNSSHTVISYAV